MRKSGSTPSEIAYALNCDKIPTRAEHKKNIDPLTRKWNRRSNYSFWTKGMITNILNDERYTGKMVSGKRKSVAVGSNKTRLRAPEDIYIVENTHEAIVSQETFDAVHSLTTGKKKVKSSKISLRGLVFCGGCRHKMVVTNHQGVRQKFSCQYKRYTDVNDCFKGLISEDELSKILVKTITAELEKTVDISKAQKQISTITKKGEAKIQQLEKNIGIERKRKLAEYIKLTKDEISEDEFVQNRQVIDERISSLTEEKEKIRFQSLSKEDASVLNLFGKYTGIDEINTAVVRDLIKAVYIYEDRRLEIVWNFTENYDANVYV